MLNIDYYFNGHRCNLSYFSTPNNSPLRIQLDFCGLTQTRNLHIAVILGLHWNQFLMKWVNANGAVSNKNLDSIP